MQMHINIMERAQPTYYKRSPYYLLCIVNCLHVQKKCYAYVTKLLKMLIS